MVISYGSSLMSKKRAGGGLSVWKTNRDAVIMKFCVKKQLRQYLSNDPDVSVVFYFSFCNL